MQQNRQSQGTRGPVESSRSGPKPRASKTQQAPIQVTPPRPRRRAAATADAGGPAGASDEGGFGVGGSRDWSLQAEARGERSLLGGQTVVLPTLQTAVRGERGAQQTCPNQP